MIKSNDFTEYYKTISNTELLSILDNPDGYQPLAIEAAKKEFSNRQLTDLDIKEAKESLIAKQIQIEKQKQKVKAIEKKVITTGNTLFDTLNPIQSEIPTTEKTIRLIVIVFGGLFLYGLIKDFWIHLSYIRDIHRFPFDSITYLLTFLFFPTGIFFFWKRKSIGWTLLVIFLIFSIVSVLSSLIGSFSWKQSNFGELSNFFPRPDPIKLIPQLIFLIGLLYVLTKENIREVFIIDKNKMFATLLISVLFASFLSYLFS